MAAQSRTSRTAQAAISSVPRVRKRSGVPNWYSDAENAILDAEVADWLGPDNDPYFVSLPRGDMLF